MVIAVPALVAGASASPAAAGDKDYDDYKITVKVCKEVKEKDDHGYYYDDNKGQDDKKKFKMHVKTYGDYEKVKVRDDECKKVELDYKKGYYYFTVYEDDVKGYEFKYIKCEYGAENDYYDKHKCNFKYGTKYAKVTVYNEKVDKDHDYDY